MKAGGLSGSFNVTESCPVGTFPVLSPVTHQKLGVLGAFPIKKWLLGSLSQQFHDISLFWCKAGLPSASLSNNEIF